MIAMSNQSSSDLNNFNSLTSKDWIGSYANSHVDIDPEKVFAGNLDESNSFIAHSSQNQQVESMESLTAESKGTDWINEYYANIKGSQSKHSSETQRPSLPWSDLPYTKSLPSDAEKKNLKVPLDSITKPEKKMDAMGDSLIHNLVLQGGFKDNTESIYPEETNNPIQPRFDTLRSNDWIGSYAETHIDIDPRNAFDHLSDEAKLPISAESLLRERAVATTGSGPQVNASAGMTEVYESMRGNPSNSSFNWHLTSLPLAPFSDAKTAQFHGSCVSKSHKNLANTSRDSSVHVTESSTGNPFVGDVNEVRESLFSLDEEYTVVNATAFKSSTFKQADKSAIMHGVTSAKALKKATLSAPKASSQSILIHDSATEDSMKPSAAKKRKRKPRNREPAVKWYVKIRDVDVLLGRGGRSNHHPGNISFRKQAGDLREWYRTSDKHIKTDLSQLLVDWVHNEQHGRFLQLDPVENQWYIVTNLVARRKSSQALREHMTIEERMARKQQNTKQTDTDEESS